jgi:hypothetical protein
MLYPEQYPKMYYNRAGESVKIMSRDQEVEILRNRNTNSEGWRAVPYEYHQRAKIEAEMKELEKRNFILKDEPEDPTNSLKDEIAALKELLKEKNVRIGDPPQPKTGDTPSPNFKCDVCEFTAKSAFGLRSHKMKHK